MGWWWLYYISLQVAIFFFSQKSSPKEIAEKKIYIYTFKKNSHTDLHVTRTVIYL